MQTEQPVSCHVFEIQTVRVCTGSIDVQRSSVPHEWEKHKQPLFFLCQRFGAGRPFFFRPRGLTCMWWGSYGFFWFFFINQPSLPTPFYFVLVSISVFIALSAVFRTINSPDDSPLSSFVLPVLFLPYWSFQPYVSLWKSPSLLI